MKSTVRLILIFLAVISGCSTPRALVVPSRVERNLPAGKYIPGLEENLTYHESSGFSYAFEYDSKNLYLYLTSADENFQRKVVYFGLTVWIDASGGNNTVQGFRFPKGTGMPPIRQEGSTVARINYPDNHMENALGRADETDLIGIYGNSLRTVKRRDSQIRVNAKITDKILAYEAVIPFELLRPGFNPLNDNSKIGVGLVTGNYEAPAAGRRALPPDGGRTGEGMDPQGRSGQMPGQVTGRMPQGNQMPQMGAAMRELSRPTKLWIDLDFPGQ